MTFGFPDHRSDWGTFRLLAAEQPVIAVPILGAGLSEELHISIESIPILRGQEIPSILGIRIVQQPVENSKQDQRWFAGRGAGNAFCPPLPKTGTADGGPRKRIAL